MEVCYPENNFGDEVIHPAASADWEDTGVIEFLASTIVTFGNSGLSVPELMDGKQFEENQDVWRQIGISKPKCRRHSMDEMSIRLDAIVVLDKKQQVKEVAILEGFSNMLKLLSRTKAIPELTTAVKLGKEYRRAGFPQLRLTKKAYAVSG